MKFKVQILLLLLAIVLIIGCSKDDSTSNNKLPYFDSPVQIAAVSVKGHDVAAGIFVIDPNDKKVAARFDWGDGNISDYSGFVDSGVAILAHHTYTQTGFYNVKAYAKNESGQETGIWSTATRIQIINTGEPYAQGILQSKTEMTVGNSITVSAMLEELAGFQVQARVDWADGMISAWSDLTDPSTVHTFTHTYNQVGTYQILIQARSSVDSLSVWYETPTELHVYNPPPANELVMIPAGTFVMGSLHVNALVNEAPLDTVDVEAFYMSKFEISQAEWMAVMGSNPAHFYELNQEINAPVENVDWYDCLEYCNRRSVMEGLTPVYSINGETDYTLWPANWNPAFPDTSAYQNQIACDFSANGYRLPTEAEWEYAAKAGTNSTYSGTNSFSELVNYAWYGIYPYQTHIVGLKQPNAWGLYDMTGNVWEWCWDAYRLYPGNTALLNADSRSLRIGRGGAWNSASSGLRTSYRNTLKPSLKTFVHGLRVVRTAQ